METIISAIQNTPIPTILILAGLLFLLLGFVTKLGGIIEVSPEQKRLTLPVGLLVLVIGLLLNFIPPGSLNPSAPDPKPQKIVRGSPKTEEPPTETDPVRDAAHRARWPSYNFPEPNGGLLVYTIMPDGNPACASYDGTVCLWGLTYDEIDFERLIALVCGENHRAKFGVTGYEDPKHWCSQARNLR